MARVVEGRGGARGVEGAVDVAVGLGMVVIVDVEGLGRVESLFYGCGKTRLDLGVEKCLSWRRLSCDCLKLDRIRRDFPFGSACMMDRDTHSVGAHRG